MRVFVIGYLIDRSPIVTRDHLSYRTLVLRSLGLSQYAHTGLKTYLGSNRWHTLIVIRD